MQPIRTLLPALCATACLAATALAQTGPGCQPTLGYLAAQIPATGSPQLDRLRHKILTTRIADVLAQSSHQRLSVEQTINLANLEADGSAANLPKLEARIRAFARHQDADQLLNQLDAHTYTGVDLSNDALGTANRAYIANDWEQLASKETANQLFCFTLATPGQPDGPYLRLNESTEPVAPADAAARANPEAEPAESAPAPDLESTLNFLQSRLNALGPITWTEATQPRTRHAAEHLQQNTVEMSSVEAEPARCGISFHERHATNPSTGVPSEQDAEVSFNQPATISLEPLAALTREDYRSSPSFEFHSLTPDITVLRIGDAHHHQTAFYFTDPDEAQKVADAAHHAADLCSQRADATP